MRGITALRIALLVGNLTVVLYMLRHPHEPPRTKKCRCHDGGGPAAGFLRARSWAYFTVVASDAIYLNIFFNRFV